jgi:hypothetical protein
MYDIILSILQAWHEWKVKWKVDICEYVAHLVIALSGVLLMALAVALTVRIAVGGVLG